MGFVIRAITIVIKTITNLFGWHAWFLATLGTRAIGGAHLDARSQAGTDTHGAEESQLVKGLVAGAIAVIVEAVTRFWAWVARICIADQSIARWITGLYAPS